MGYEYLYGCASSSAAHYCHDCPEGQDIEYGRTRQGGFITASYLPSIVADPTDLAAWEAGIASGDIIMIPEISGSFDPGDPKELKGYGNRKVTYGPRDMKWSFNDPIYLENYAFYNEVSRRANMVPFFVTATILHLFDTVGNIKAKNVVTDDLDTEVIWQVDVTVTSRNLPTLHAVDAIASIFSCAVF